jgi:hypothetical protein
MEVPCIMIHTKMNKKALWAIPATIAIVVISGAAAKFAVDQMNKPNKTFERSEEVRQNEETVVNDEQSSDKEVEISPTITITTTPITTQTVLPTQTVVPTPTAYLKHSNPATPREEMENRICKEFGEQMCNPVLSLRVSSNNIHLAEDFQWSNKTFGVFGIPCLNTKVHTLLGYELTEDQQMRFDKCKTAMLNSDNNIRLLKMFIDSYGYKEAQVMISRKS